MPKLFFSFIATLKKSSIFERSVDVTREKWNLLNEHAQWFFPLRTQSFVRNWWISKYAWPLKTVNYFNDKERNNVYYKMLE